MSAAFATFLQLCRRWPYCVVSTLLSILLGAAAAFLWVKENNSLRADLSVRTDESVTTEDKINRKSKMQKHLAEVRAVTQRIEENLVDVDNSLAQNLGYFYKFEEMTKAQLLDLRPVSSPTTDKSTLYRRVPFGLRVAGTYDQVAAFLLALETSPRLLKVTSFNLSRTEPNGRTVALDLNVELLGKK